ncbi:TPR_REGION domain-containing protein [Rubrivivax sp. A210]|uniref:XrtA/PEP-CTERM system TPR-repeat protein PrsT n=1 Tax=Rubrivivax sp. A210 TaxID=2772301 RepID=UPI00191ACFBA|nr:XrtA/PEP-CTERM system TPR-repeat protein PrsT [Rubrivivax sp. A210]CAD5375189.1 TPR_REGION domain-containing protein [Rubrivivax sp. A210]
MNRILAAACLSVAALSLVGCGGESEKDLIASAKTALEKKDAKAALIQLKNAIQKNPRSGDARFLLGKTLLESGDPVAAAVELRKAQELQISDEQVLPELARAMLLLGEEAKIIVQYAPMRLKDDGATADLQTSVAVAYAVQGDPAKAREAIDAALKARATHAPAIIVQARLKAGEADFDGALALLESVLAKEPTNERAGVLKGEILFGGKKDVAAALEAYRKVLGVNPKSMAAHSAVVTLLYAQKKDGEAKAQIAEMKKVAPNHPETLFFEAQVAFSEKNYKLTREITERMLKAMPDNVRVLELAGAAEFAQRQYAQAETLLGKALKGAPGLLRARHMLAQTYLRSNQPNKAVDVLQPVLDGKQVDGATLALAGEAWMQMGDTKKAEAAFQAGAKAAPDDPRVRTSAALSQLARGDTGAIAELENIAASDKGLRADLALISARLSQKDVAGALKAIDALERKVPEQPLAPNLRGRVLLLKGDVAGAAKSFEAALAKDAHFFPAIASLAAMDLSASKPEAARKRFEDLLKVQPRNFQALLALAELSARSGGTPADVLKLTRDAVKASPAEPTPHLVLVNQLLAAGEAKDALAAAQAATAALPNDLGVMEVMGRAQMAAGEGNQAVATFKKLAALQPSNAQNQVLLAEAHMAAKDSDNAARALRRALEIKPDLQQAQRGLVALAVMDKRPQDGLNLAREMQKKDPKAATGFALEGDVEASRRNWEPAVAAYRAALQRAANTDNAVRLHSTLRQAGRNADADKVAADWLKASPKDGAFLFYMGDVQMAANDAAGAEARYRAVLDLQPNNALALNNVAWLLVKQGKPGGLAMAEKANKLFPERGPLLDTLAAAQASENQLPQAIETQLRAIARTPGDPSFKLNLARYYAKAGDKAKARAELDALAKLGDKFGQQAEVSKLLQSL